VNGTAQIKLAGKSESQMTQDLFISYSSKDRKFVNDLCIRLSKAGVTFWLDLNEIKPGEYIRDKISRGIDSARFMLLILSPNSVQSEWVKREIDAAMIREIESKNVTVIPLLIGDVLPNDCPSDLRGKKYLDFRTANSASIDFVALVNLIRPEVRQRRNLINELKLGLVDDDRKLEKLRGFALRYGDQVIQKAALTGLSKIASPEAINIIAERLLDFWGMSSISHAINLLSKLEKQGGLIILTVALFWDDRFTGRMFEIILKQSNFTEEFRQFVEKRTFNGIISNINAFCAFDQYAPPELSAAMRFGSQYCPYNEGIIYGLPKIHLSILDKDKETLDNNLPGLTTLISERLQFRGYSESEGRTELVGHFFDFSHLGGK
jgi:TIR domain